MIKLFQWGSVHSIIPIMLLLVIGLAPLVEIANGLSTPLLSAPLRAYLLEGLVGSLCLLSIFIGIRRAWRPGYKYAWVYSPFPFVLILFLWSLFCFFESPYPEFAYAELLRVVLCLSVYMIAANALYPGQIHIVIGGLVLLGTGIAADGLLQFGAARGGGEARAFDHTLGLFGDNENLGSFLMILLPLAIRQILSRENSETIRLSALATSLILLITLLITCVRAAWIGESFALIVMVILSLRDQPLQQRFRRQHWLPIVVATAIILTTLLIVGVNQMIMNRTLSLAKTPLLYSFTDRIHKSEAATRMAMARPVTGWGLGTWPVVQQKWTKERDTPDQVFARHDVWSRGGDQQSLAHNFYAQWAAETGYVGLCLYLVTISTFFFLSLRRLPKIQSIQMRGILISCIAAVSGGCLDAIASPAYNFPGVSALLWLCMGLGTASSFDKQISSSSHK